MGREQRIPDYQLLRSPALRGQDLCYGLSKEQENLPAGVKRECRITERIRQRVSIQRSRGGLTRSSESVKLSLVKTGMSEGVNELKATCQLERG